MAKKILVIDDDEGILEGFQAVLETEGYSVSTSTHSLALNLLLKKELPDLIILDVLLSGEDGRDICKRLKSQSRTKHIPIIMVSAQPKVSDSTKEAGADAYISKPFEIDELLQKIRIFL